MVSPDRLRAAYLKARDVLLAARDPAGYWVGELSSSALSTATATAALTLTGNRPDLVDAGIRWLRDHQNDDGGWGDTIKSKSNISTTMLCRAAFHIARRDGEHATVLAGADQWLAARFGSTAELHAEAVRQRYGKDRTFSVPILMMSALAKLVSWREVPTLPFQLACLPQSWYRFAGLPVVSYALPALIAIGQCVAHHRPSRNPLTQFTRRAAVGPSLRVLARMQPSSGGFLEATPLTSFVVMALATVGQTSAHARAVIAKGVEFLIASIRPDGSWPIDSNLSIWVTTLSINALAVAGDLEAITDRDRLRDWLLFQQTSERHPFTGADAGAWGWSHLPGSVPDCDDTPGALLALTNLGEIPDERRQRAEAWVMRLQNRDGGVPTFCRGWGKLPFDRSGTDLTAHTLRALCRPHSDADEKVKRFRSRALAYLQREQRGDGTWLPLWFGNQHAADDTNPVYGTARVLAAYRDLGLASAPSARHAVQFLYSAQNPDGGWGGAQGVPSSVEETALVVDVLFDLVLESRETLDRGILWLVERVEAGAFVEPSPIGFYFAKLWYFEKLYPIIFTVAALGRAWRSQRRASATE